MRARALLTAILMMMTACKERGDALTAADPIRDDVGIAPPDGGGGHSDDAVVIPDTAPPDTSTVDTGPPPPPPPDASSLGWPGWENATIYFMITDRFFDGNPANNHSYGRKSDGLDEVGTFHGGDLAGITQKLEGGFFTNLGVSALWITAPYEQIHGWVVGGGGQFAHYSYHGYYPLDWTTLDENFGTEAELEKLVDTAHSLGIRVLVDVVLNHAGYATARDLSELEIDVLQPGWEDASVAEYYDFIDFDSLNWANWWGPQWVRADLPGYSAPGNNPFTQQVTFLPDFKTESPVTVAPPPFFAKRPHSKVEAREGYRVRDYLIEWLTRWIREYGIDGFRCDTVKHVELDAWAELAAAADAAHAEWRANHPDKAFPDEEYPDLDNTFWMVGEVFPHGVTKSDYFDHGFDAVLNFDFQGDSGKALADPKTIDAIYVEYAEKLNGDPDFNVVTYASSHDTDLFFDKWAKGDLDKQKLGGTFLMLSPGAIQVFYGDENARPEGPGGGDATQGTRSDYQWGANPQVLSHWQKLGVFRKKHHGVGAGAHTKIADDPYTFRRQLDDDTVYVVLLADGKTTVDVSADWADGDPVRNAYTDTTTTVKDGAVTLSAKGPILLERVLE